MTIKVSDSAVAVLILKIAGATVVHGTRKPTNDSPPWIFLKADLGHQADLVLGVVLYARRFSPRNHGLIMAYAWARKGKIG
jgi:hypothetical protein